VPAPEPRTHYQVSFTSRQAVLLFVVVLVSLAGAYFLGILTGLAGRQPADGVAAEAPPTAVPSAASTPASDAAPALSAPAQSKAAAAESRTTPPALAAREPGTAGGLQFFEDHPEEAPKTTPAPAEKKAAASAGAAGGYWVQVLATSSEREARSYRTKLSARGYRAAIAAARGPKGPQYRVRVGPYASREEAARAEEALVRKEKARTWIVSPGQ
jgi:cell division septation protein DedD